MAKVIPGKAFLIEFGGIEFECQNDLTFTATANTEASEPCKPASTETYDGAKNQTYTVTSTDWTGTVNVKAVDALTNNQVEVLKTMKIGKIDELRIFTSEASTEVTLVNDFEISGDAVLTEFSLSAPQGGEATYDLSFQGTGEYTVTALPATT